MSPARSELGNCPVLLGGDDDDDGVGLAVILTDRLYR